LKVLVATTAMLSFISFWRAAAIVLNDLGSSAYYGDVSKEASEKHYPGVEQIREKIPTDCQTSDN
jgi:hypothetical protein